MATYALTFISTDGGVQPSNLCGDKAFVRGLLRIWYAGDHYDRVCLLEVPSPSERKRTTFRGQAFVFNREEALRWASN